MNSLSPNFIVSLLVIPMKLVVLVRAVDHADLTDMVDEETDVKVNVQNLRLYLDMLTLISRDQLVQTRLAETHSR